MRVRFVILGLMLGSACGYRLGIATAPPAGIRTVAVPAFANLSFEPGVEHAFTQAARAELQRRGVVRVVRSGEDAVLVGRVLKFDLTPGGLVPQPGAGGKQVPQRYRAQATIDVSLILPETGEVIWSDRLGAAADFDEALAPGFEAMARKVRQQDAADSIASQVMREAFDRMLADF